MSDIEIQEGSAHKGSGVKKAKKRSTRVDMTPMVDLGFLLITFFIFTTTLSQPTAMNLFLPKETKNSDEQNKVKESGAFTILLGGKDKICYYEGMDPLKIKVSNFKKIRDSIIDKKKRTPSEDLVVIIKPSAEATYKNTIDILDEMTINQITRYAMIDITDQEYELLKKAKDHNDLQKENE